MKLYDVHAEENESCLIQINDDTGVVGNGFDFSPKKFEKEKVSGWKI